MVFKKFPEKYYTNKLMDILEGNSKEKYVLDSIIYSPNYRIDNMFDKYFDLNTKRSFLAASGGDGVPSHATNNDDKSRRELLNERVARLEKEERNKRIKKIKRTLIELADQFGAEYFYGRELVQNSVDANATRIDVKFSYSAKKHEGIVSFRDNGQGMNYEIIRKKLLTLFDSTKELDSKKIGRFGVGFVSIFAQSDLEEIIVSTSDGVEDHLVSLLPEKKDWHISIKKNATTTKPKRGTRIDVRIKTSNYYFNKELKKDMASFLRKSCAHIKVPLYISGRKINKDFDFPNASYKMSFGGDTEIEGVIAFTPNKSKTYFYNRRILVKESNYPLFLEDKNLSVIVSSSFFDYDISRENIIENDRFKKIMNYLQEQKDNFYYDLISRLESKEQFGFSNNKVCFFGQPFFYHRLKDLIESHKESKSGTGNWFSKSKNVLVGRAKQLTKNISAKDLTSYLPDDLKEKNLFTVAFWEDDHVALKRVSLNEVLDQAITEKAILTGYINERMDETRDVSKILQSGRFLIPSVESSYNQEHILELFYPIVRAVEKYHVAEFVDSSNLSNKQKLFLEGLKMVISKSPLSKYIDTIVFDDKVDNMYRVSPIDAQYFTENDQLIKKSSSISSSLKNFAYQRENLLLSTKNVVLNESIDLVDDSTYSHMAYVPLLTALSFTLKIRNNNLPLKMKNFIIQTYGSQLEVDY